MPIASHYIRRGLSLRRDFARQASDRGGGGYLTILDKVRVLPDKEGGKGTWQRISRRRMDQSRNFASNVAPPSARSLRQSAPRPFQSPARCALEASGAFLTLVVRRRTWRPPQKRLGPAELLLKDYAVTHVLTRAPRRCLPGKRAILPCPEQPVNN